MLHLCLYLYTKDTLCLPFKMPQTCYSLNCTCPPVSCTCTCPIRVIENMTHQYQLTAAIENTITENSCFCFFSFFWSVISRDFPWFQDIFYKSPYASKSSWMKRSSHHRKGRSSVYCVQTSSFLFVGMWRVCHFSKIKHPGGSGGSRPNGDLFRYFVS